MLADRTYRDQSAQGWTRIEMLLELYDAALMALESCQEAAAQNDQATLNANALRAQRILLGLLSGIDITQGEIAANPARLCLFALDCIQREEFADAHRVLGILRDAFHSIAPEAIEWEREHCPAVSPSPVVDFHV